MVTDSSCSIYSQLNKCQKFFVKIVSCVKYKQVRFYGLQCACVIVLQEELRGSLTSNGIITALSSHVDKLSMGNKRTLMVLIFHLNRLAVAQWRIFDRCCHVFVVSTTSAINNVKWPCLKWPTLRQIELTILWNGTMWLFLTLTCAWFAFEIKNLFLSFLAQLALI